MISGVAHELNNPLAVIKGYLELILARHELSNLTRADLEKVARESNRAANLVSNFLSFAREQPTHRQSTDLNEIVQRVVELRKFDVRIAGADLALDIEANLPSTQADADQIQQVLVNLINNALHAILEADRAGRLKISTRAQGAEIRVLVEDNGPGVPEHVLPRIFEPFFTTKEVGAGTGLGLSIAHSIMTEHNGRIFYRRSPTEGGACFVLEFPIAQPSTGEHSETAIVAGTGGEPSEAPTGARILIVDDERSLAELLGEMLGILGHVTTVCCLPAHALDLLERNQYDVVLSDYRMPGMDGERFYRAAIKRRPQLANRFIFLTGDLINPETQAFLESIGSPHLAKPFQLERVEQVLAEILGHTARAA